ncbi:MAG: M28 family peptidase, partial [Acidimicrobiia bacterium]|nr:M28 family peptidase [Acidimicrobiia bacterium]
AHVGGGDVPDLMVSVDMVGWGDDLAAVYLRETDPSAALLAIQVAAGLGQTAVLREAGPISDHEPFALAGVPSVMLWRPDNPAYHTAADDSARPEWLAGTLDLVVAILESQRTSGP